MAPSRKHHVVGLMSGGKDSVFSLIKCAEYGHTLVCLANLHAAAGALPEGTEELDSYMYQTVGAAVIPAIADCLGLPLIRPVLR